MKKIVLATDPTGKCPHCARVRKDITAMCRKQKWEFEEETDKELDIYPYILVYIENKFKGGFPAIGHNLITLFNKINKY